MRYGFVIIVYMLLGCVALPDRDESDAELYQRHSENMDKLTAPSSLRNNRMESVQWYEDKVLKGTTQFSTVNAVEKGCSKFYIGEGSDRKEIVSLFIPDGCETLYTYFIQAKIQCLSESPISFPLLIKGRTIYWELKGKRGRVTSDQDGLIRIVFASAENFQITDRLRLSLSESYDVLLPNKFDLVLPESQCRQSRK